jgi:hypothetical protein
MTVEIRRALPDEGRRLKEIAVAAKRFWGYEPERVARYVRDSEPSPWGRIIPVLGIDLDA